MTILWTQVSGPGTATFATPTALISTVSFSAGGVYVLRLTVDEELGQGPVSDDVQITAIAPPVITTTSLPTAIMGTPYSQTVVAIDGQLPYVFSLVAGALPAGLSLASSGVISGTPSGPQLLSSFTVRVTDALSQTDDQALTIQTVGPPTITTTSLSSGPGASSYSQTLTAIQGTLPYTWSLLSGSLPPGIALTAAGVLSGTLPSTLTTYPFTVRVTDALAFTDDQALSITVTWDGVPVAITTLLLPTATSGTAYSGLVEAAFGVPPYVFSVAGGFLPPGLSLASSGVVSGTPTALGRIDPTVLPEASYGTVYAQQLRVVNTTGDYSVRVRVTDAIAGTDDQDFPITLVGPPPYTFSLLSGSLPTNLTLSSSGLITGTPPAAPLPPFMTPPPLPAGIVDQPYTFPLTVTGTGESFTFTVRATIGTVRVPDQTYTLVLATWSTSGGTVTWVVVPSSPGSLPKCIRLNGVNGMLSGTPVQVGSTSFTIRATDSYGRIVEQTYTISSAS